MRMNYARKPVGKKRGEKGDKPQQCTVLRPRVPSAPNVEEDHQAILRHMKRLKTECSRTTRNTQVCGALMARTFAYRRGRVLKENRTTAEITAEFPGLTSPIVVSYYIRLLLHFHTIV